MGPVWRNMGGGILRDVEAVAKLKTVDIVSVFDSLRSSVS
jgi:hypothetical protein